MPEVLRICFIGNSLTYYNDMPHLVEHMLTPNLLAATVETGACLRGGKSLKTIWEEGADMVRANSRIGNKGMVESVEKLLEVPAGWDIIVLNDFSQHPARPESREESSTILKEKYIPAISRMAERSGKTPLILIYSTWGYFKPAKGSEGIGDFKVMSRKLAAGCMSYAALIHDSGLHAGVAEVGEACEAIHDRDRDLWASLYQPDHFHPKPLGTFLIACVVAKTIIHHPMFASRFSGCRIDPAWPAHIACSGPVVADDPDHFKNPSNLSATEASQVTPPTQDSIEALLKTVGGFVYAETDDEQLRAKRSKI